MGTAHVVGEEVERASASAPVGRDPVGPVLDRSR